MNNVQYKWLTITGWLGSWLVIFWINFAAELSMMMHLVAVPALLITTALGAGWLFENNDCTDCR